MIDITSVLPHRYPFIFVDRITEREAGKWVKGRKMVTHNEWFFQGHFPEKPIMPGVLIIEAIAQLGAFVDYGQEDGKLGMIASIESLKFTKPVVPGDELNLYFEVITRKDPFIKGRGYASVDGKKVAVVDGLTVFRK